MADFCIDEAFSEDGPLILVKANDPDGRLPWEGPLMTRINLRDALFTGPFLFDGITGDTSIP